MRRHVSLTGKIDKKFSIIELHTLSALNKGRKSNHMDAYETRLLAGNTLYGHHSQPKGEKKKIYVLLDSAQHHTCPQPRVYYRFVWKLISKPLFWRRNFMQDQNWARGVYLADVINRRAAIKTVWLNVNVGLNENSPQRVISDEETGTIDRFNNPNVTWLEGNEDNAYAIMLQALTADHLRLNRNFLFQVLVPSHTSQNVRTPNPFSTKPSSQLPAPKTRSHLLPSTPLSNPPSNPPAPNMTLFPCRVQLTACSGLLVYPLFGTSIHALASSL
jgi:hypothetical protein